jgi:aryl-alcohol dehydrogenase-like predicted oxidoreductase
MQYVRLGRSGLVVSRLAFGAMTFGTGDIPGVYKVDQGTARTMVDRALDAGINLFDTADAYAAGVSEQWLGQLLQKRRADVVIATKAGFRTDPGLLHTGGSRRHLLAACDASLTRLGTDWIDLYQVHRFDPITPLEETLEALDSLVRSGKVRYIGFSNWSAWQAARAVALQERYGWARFVSGQLYYSAVGRDLEDELVPFVQDAEIGTLIWSPLAGGLLTGKYQKDAPPSADQRLASFDVLPVDREMGFRVVEVLREIATARGVSVAQVALAWVLHQPAVSSVIVGASKLGQLEDNLGAAQLSLSTSELTAIEQAGHRQPTYPRWFQQNLADRVISDALKR